MVARAVGRVGDEREVLEDLGAARDVRFHDGIFLVGQPARLVQHRIGDADLADVVKQRCLVQVLLLLLAETVFARDHLGVVSNAVGMHARARVLRVHRVGDGEDGLVAHLHLLQGQRELCLLQLERVLHPPAGDVPRQPADVGAAHDDHVQDEPPVVVDGRFLRDAIRALRPDLAGRFVGYRQVQHVIARAQVRVDNLGELALAYPDPILVHALQVERDVRVFQAVVRNLGIEHDGLRRARHHQLLLGANRLRRAIHAHVRDHEPIGQPARTV